MKLHSHLYAIIAIVITAFASCTENDKSVGVTIQPQEDKIIVNADTFIIESENYYVPAISAQADTMVVGEFYSPKFGPTKADLIVQVAPPIDYKFPSDEYNPKPDSLVLMMFYNTWLGSPYSPLEFSIYENNIATPQYATRYMSDFDPGMFTDSSILMGKRLATSIDLSRADSVKEDTASTPYIRYRFDNEQLQRFWNIPHDAYSSEDNFLDYFKGMYITTRYGSSTMIHLNQITLFLYYHYTYKRQGKDTVVNTSIVFPANKEVRQLNRFYHKDIESIAVSPDSLCYVKSAAGIYPKITLPLGKINSRIKASIGNKQLNISGAEIKIEALYDKNDIYITPPTYLLAVTEEEFLELIKNNTPPTAVDTTQVLAMFEGVTDTYSFNFNYLLTKHLRRTDIQDDEVINMILVPVHVETTTSGAALFVKPLTKLSAVAIKNGRCKSSPMRLKILYNGF